MTQPAPRMPPAQSIRLMVPSVCVICTILEMAPPVHVRVPYVVLLSLDIKSGGRLKNPRHLDKWSSLKFCLFSKGKSQSLESLGCTFVIGLDK